MPAPRHTSSGRDPRGRIDRRVFLGQAVAALGVWVFGPRLPEGRPGPARILRSSGKPLDLEELSLAEAAEGLETGRFTSRGLVAGYLARIEAIDRGGPRLNAILELNPAALEIAEALDAERKARGPRSGLHGIPILVKDIFGTADGMHTSAGSLALADYVAPRDAAVVARLRAAGCVILGKTNMSEWSNARGRSSVAGWSARGGVTLNPYELDRTAGGSSSGSAAAVAASLAAAAVGAEAMGSIVSPSSICGVVGLKPTVGLISRAGTIPVSLTQETPGPIARTVRDAALLLSAIAGADPADPFTQAAGAHVEADYARFLDPEGLKGARIGVARNLFGANLAADRVIDRCLRLMAAAGAIVVDPAEIETAGAVWTFDSEVLMFELKAVLDQFLGGLDQAMPVHSLRELIAFNERNRDRELKWFGQEFFEYAATRGPLTSPEYQQALTMVRQLARERGIDATLARHRLDALVAPTQPPASLIDPMLGDSAPLGSFVTSAAAGYPCLTVPAGDVAGLPVGILFMGPAWSEGKLLRLGFAFEQLVQARRPPAYVASEPRPDREEVDFPVSH
jgi:amidase